jgi:hypothetical protein
MKKEELFSQQDLIDIQKEALHFGNQGGIGYNRQLIAINGQATAKTITTISKNNKLIFVKGNEHTGFAHIVDRHSRLSLKNYWITREKNNPKLDNPTKFHPQMHPIIHFVEIADVIFNPQNKNESENKKPELFDLYIGIYNFTGKLEEKYRLLTYKDTKIVHTLFLVDNKKKYNPKKICDFAKGSVSSSFKLPEGYDDLIVPYQDAQGIIRYSILIRKDISDSEKIS